MNLVPTRPPTDVVVPADLMAAALELAKASRAQSTLATYDSAWRQFLAWCELHGLPYLPANVETVTAYVAAQADALKPATVKKHLAAIAVAHRAAGLPTPTASEQVKLTMAGLRRTRGTAPVSKRAIRIEHIRQMVTGLRSADVDVRDRAILLLGFSTGMRRSEIVMLDVEDLGFEPEGVVVTIRRSKRDQEGAGRQVPVLRGQHEETCTVRALRRWLSLLGQECGPLFVRLDQAGNGQRLTGKSVALVVKKRAEQAGLDPLVFSGHSLRRGFCTSAARAGASEAEIARTTGHRSLLVLRGYFEQGRLFDHAAARVLDL